MKEDILKIIDDEIKSLRTEISKILDDPSFKLSHVSHEVAQVMILRKIKHEINKYENKN
jgi:hypothetical protein